jgi:cytoskeletal protein RodZ
MFQQLKNKFQVKSAGDKVNSGTVPFKTAMHKAAQAGGTAAEEKVEKHEMASNFMAGRAAGQTAGIAKAEVAQESQKLNATVTNTKPVQAGGKSGLVLLAVIAAVIFALTKCGG